MKHVLTILILIGLSGFAFAQVERINVKVENITCGLCFTLAQTSLHKTSGVKNVVADAHTGQFEIQTSPGVSVREVMDRIKVAGFQRGNNFEITVRGKLEKRGNRIVLVAPGQSELFIVEENSSKGRMAANVAHENGKARIVASVSGSGNQYNLNVRQMSKD
jgi:copper chaperone CopZ